jgi:hypothetical protein
LPRWQFYFRKGSASDAKSLIKASITVKWLLVLTSINFESEKSAKAWCPNTCEARFCGKSGWQHCPKWLNIPFSISTKAFVIWQSQRKLMHYFTTQVELFIREIHARISWMILNLVRGIIF